VVSTVVSPLNSISHAYIRPGLPDADAAKVWIIRNQFGRRNITPFTRVELVLLLEPLPQNSAKADTREELAKLSGVSHDTIARGKVIQAKVSEEVKAALAATL
jgi:hypothetical protein